MLPKPPNALVNAACVNLIPCNGAPSRTPVVRITKAVNVKIIMEAIPLPSHNLLLFFSNGQVGFADLNDQTSIYNKEKIVNDLDGHLQDIDHTRLFLAQQFYIENGYLYFMADSYTFFEEGLTPPVQSLTEDSNPVVVKLKLK